ncbi:MAG: hypothetical protein HY691_19095 [Chloroflexi bacterium]|nr:hypothetical protein [Chloroflexota bacterium]
MTELIWDGKYDKDGHRVAPLRVSLPFQTVETVNESAQERQRTLDLFSTGRDPATWSGEADRRQKPQPPRMLKEIRADILALQRETEGLLSEIAGGGGR